MAEVVTTRNHPSGTRTSNAYNVVLPGFLRRELVYINLLYIASAPHFIVQNALECETEISSNIYVGHWSRPALRDTTNYSF
jgi:hypothetical protein